MGQQTQRQLDELHTRLDRLERENRRLRDELRDEISHHAAPNDARRATWSRRGLLAGGAAAVGAAAVASVPARAAAAPAPVLLEVQNSATRPTGISGFIKDPADTDLFTSVFTANNSNDVEGSGIYAVATSIGVNGLASGANGTGVFARSEAAGQGVHGYVYGAPATPPGEFTSGVWGQSGYDESPAFLADASITMRTLANPGGIPVSGHAKPGDLSIRTDGAGGSTWWVCVSEADGGEPAQFVRVAAPGAAGAFEVLPAPVRVYDSRVGAPPATGPKTPLVGTASRTVSCTANTGGAVPTDARAVLVNLTVTGTSAAGFASVYPAGTAWLGTSNLNFAAGQTIANSVTVGCGPDATIAVRMAEAGVSANFIVDVMGFYR